MALAVLAFPWAVSGAPGLDAPPVVVVCVDATDPAEGLELAAVKTALAIEARKAGQTLAPCSEDADPTRTVRIALSAAPAARAEVRYPNGARRQFDVAATPALDRATEVARAAFEAADRPPALALGADLAPAPPSAPTPGAPARVTVHVGGRYDHGVGAAVGAVGLEVDAAVMWSERWGIGVQALWQPERDLGLGEPVSARLQIGSVAAIGRVALAVGPVFVRPAVGVGAEWRAIDVRAPDGGEEERLAELLVLVETDVVWPVWRWLRLGVGVGARVYPTGTVWTWRETTVYDAPRVVLGGALRVGGSW